MNTLCDCWAAHAACTESLLHTMVVGAAVMTSVLHRAQDTVHPWSRTLGQTGHLLCVHAHCCHEQRLECSFTAPMGGETAVPPVFEQVSGLSALWLSHKHADHMLGTLGILQARARYDQPLLVSALLSSRHRIHALLGLGGPLFC